MTGDQQQRRLNRRPELQESLRAALKEIESVLQGALVRRVELTCRLAQVEGRPLLTARERDVVRYVSRGLRSKEIAGALGIMPGTVKVHLQHIFEKTGLKDRGELAVAARHLLDTQAEAGLALSA